MNSQISIEKYLRETGKLTYKNAGVSMMPLLKQGRDLFTLEAYRGQSLKKYDVVMFKRKNGKYVLHRIININSDGTYEIMGDNCVTSENHIKKDAILGIMTSFVHRGREIKVDNRLYKMYVRFWWGITPFRIILKKMRRMVARVVKILRNAQNDKS